MAISYDSSAQLETTSSSPSFNHTCSGSDRILFVYLIMKSTSVGVNSATYNSSNMTLITSMQLGSTNTKMFLYYIIAPSTGTNAISFSLTSSVKLKILSASYTGAKQTSQPDAYGTVNNATTINSETASITTIANNCWTIMAGGTEIDGGWDLTAGTGSHLITATSYSAALFDSNAPITPAGSKSMTTDAGGAGQIGLIISSFSPVPASGPVNVKTINGLVIASVKTYNGLVIASVKSINGLQ